MTMREEFEENYMAVEEPASNRRGFKIKYRYVGPWCILGDDSHSLQKAKRMILNCQITSLVLYIVAGTTESAMNCSRMVSIFAMLSAAALVFEVTGTIQFLMAHDKTTVPDFEDIRRKLLIAPVMHFLLLSLAALAGFWFWFNNRSAVSDLLIPVCFLAAGLLSLEIYRTVRKLPFRKEKNQM